MQLGRFLAKNRIIDLTSPDLVGALGELLDVCPLKGSVKTRRDKILNDLVAREQNMSTYLGEGVALPSAKVAMSRPYLIAVGRAPAGLVHEGIQEYNEVRILVLLLAGKEERGYLNVLASIARVFQEKLRAEELVKATSLEEFKEGVAASFGAKSKKGLSSEGKSNRFMLKEANRVAKNVGAGKLMIFGDTFEDAFVPNSNFTTSETLLVSNANISAETRQFFDDVIPVRSFSTSRLSQLRSAVLIGLTRGILAFDDKLCCLSGIPRSNEFDTLTVVNIEKEFQSVFTEDSKLLPPTVRPEILERVFGIATELAIEGREGKSVGCLFVLGDTEALKPYTKPLVLNPFYGHKEEDRNILNPFMDETVKELSSIDGAFLIQGNGVLQSAGTLLNAPEFTQELPGGLGSRHAAAAAISKAVDCIAIVVSSSTGQVTVFRNGEMLALVEKVSRREL